MMENEVNIKFYRDKNGGMKLEYEADHEFTTTEIASLIHFGFSKAIEKGFNKEFIMQALDQSF